MLHRLGVIQDNHRVSKLCMHLKSGNLEVYLPGIFLYPILNYLTLFCLFCVFYDLLIQCSFSIF